jgi:Xaa-Pro aminopeptidase
MHNHHDIENHILVALKSGRSLATRWRDTPLNVPGLRARTIDETLRRLEAGDVLNDQDSETLDRIGTALAKVLNAMLPGFGDFARAQDTWSGDVISQEAEALRQTMETWKRLIRTRQEIADIREAARIAVGLLD